MAHQGSLDDYALPENLIKPSFGQSISNANIGAGRRARWP